ncbi:MAG: hydroxyacid dehydrogenase [Alphaproteobacteria bacterium]|nr:hydroxyacid dehydrogenase [Alphaproteobacteria bacterium]
MPDVLVLGRIHTAGIDRLRGASCTVRELPDHPADLTRHAAAADAIIVRMTRLDAAAIDAAPGLRIVARHGVGYEAVDVDALTARGIPLALVGDVNSGAVAEHTLALMLGLAKRLTAYDRATRQGDFAVRDSFSARELSGKAVLVVGFGRIGRAVARLCACFGMSVIAADPFVDASTVEAAGYTHVSDFRAALDRADYVTIHVPKAPGADYLIGAPEIAALKPEAAVLNLSRGGIVDESALREALLAGRLRGAALDVFEDEPPGPDNPLFALDSVIVSPHCAAFTEECARRMALACADNVLAAFEDRLDPSLVVNREVLR